MAYATKIVLRAGTYVTGMPPPISASLRPLGTGMRVRERRAADGAQIEVDDAVLGGAEGLRDARGGRELDDVALAVAEAERVAAASRGARHGERRRRIDSTRKKHDRVGHSRNRLVATHARG